MDKTYLWVCSSTKIFAGNLKKNNDFFLVELDLQLDKTVNTKF